MVTELQYGTLKNINDLSYTTLTFTGGPHRQFTVFPERYDKIWPLKRLVSRHPVERGGCLLTGDEMA